MSAVLQTTEARFEPMTEQSLDAVLAIETACYSHPWTRGNFADSLQSGYDAWCFVDPAAALLGYAVAMRVLEEWHLLNLSVAAPWQGRGLGEAFLRWLAREASRHRLGTLLLEVRPSNPRAIRLYERVGMTRIGIRRRYYPDHDGRREDAIVMQGDVALIGGDGSALPSGTAAEATTAGPVR